MLMSAPRLRGSYCSAEKAASQSWMEQYLSHKVCRLTWPEVIAYAEYGILPICKNHQHCSNSKALQRIASDVSVSLTEFPELGAIVDHTSNGYVWKGRMSSGFKVRQMVRFVQG